VELPVDLGAQPEERVEHVSKQGTPHCFDAS
jgi:hypothetical protein